ncbi:molybdopterin-dependent oxidoreductase [Beijerinckia sp. L45]|uniref:molybdopterin-dependent oxidoreductase n=1 Tax=Beijerinckia sp. L45 TaxID=1641855 RepID=UPI00131CB3AE|nr:molybdopterin-dependent oxidoreductase [Beijerinckia sp. L45]
MKASPVALVLVLALTGAVDAQTAGPTVALTGLDGQQATISIADLDALPHVTLDVTQHDMKHTYEGALLTDVLAKIHVPSGKALHGPDLSDVLLVQAKDGYKVVIDLADTDAITRKDRVILADKMDGAALSEKQGPFQLIVEGDLRPARSARMVTAITVKRVQ